ncbi:hypothetical protein GW755_04040 [bacterium]|nr:hypothetical protein [bacterium]
MKLNPAKTLATAKESSWMNMCFKLSSSIEINKLDNGVYAWEKAQDPKVKDSVILPLSKDTNYTFKWFSPEGKTDLEELITLSAGSGLTFEGIYFVTTKDSYGFCYIPADLSITLSKNTNLSQYGDKYAFVMSKLSLPDSKPPKSVFEKFN